ncbi:MAG: hypothetical protein ABI859_06255 [Pseudomonadota bacterium]
MKTLIRSLLMAVIGALVIGALTHVGTLNAQGQTQSPPPATAPPAAPPAADAPPPPENPEPAPGDRISADNNVTFPTDI